MAPVCRPTIIEELVDTRSSRLPRVAATPWTFERFIQQSRQAHARIERGVRVLENHLDAAVRAAAACRRAAIRPPLPDGAAVIRPCRARSMQRAERATFRSPIRRRCRASRPALTLEPDIVDSAQAAPRRRVAALAPPGDFVAPSRRCVDRQRGCLDAGRCSSSDVEAAHVSSPATHAGAAHGRARPRRAAADLAQAATAKLQRGWKRQPGGGAARSGGCAVDRLQPLARVARAPAAHASSARVYGCAGRAKMRRSCRVSTIRPAYITATRSQVCGDDAEIVGDEQHRHADVVAQLRGSA